MITGELMQSRYPPFALQRKGRLLSASRRLRRINLAMARYERGCHS